MIDFFFLYEYGPFITESLKTYNHFTSMYSICLPQNYDVSYFYTPFLQVFENCHMYCVCLSQMQPSLNFQISSVFQNPKAPIYIFVGLPSI